MDDENESAAIISYFFSHIFNQVVQLDDYHHDHVGIYPSERFEG